MIRSEYILSLNKLARSRPFHSVIVSKKPNAAAHSRQFHIGEADIGCIQLGYGSHDCIPPDADRSTVSLFEKHTS